MWRYRIITFIGKFWISFYSENERCPNIFKSQKTNSFQNNSSTFVFLSLSNLLVSPVSRFFTNHWKPIYQINRYCRLLEMIHAIISTFFVGMVMGQQAFRFRETTLFEYASFDEEVNWADAEQRCVDFNGHLVSIHNLQENNLVKEMMTELEKEDGRYIPVFVWLGARQPEEARDESGQYWSDGTRFNYLYREEICWPSLSDGCVIFHHYGSSDCWGDFPCLRTDFIAGFICS